MQQFPFPQFPDSYPETLRDLAICIHETIGKLAANSADPALVITEGIRARFGGSLLYIPKDTKQNLADRDAELRAAFTGHNHRELARRYGMALTSVYRTLAKRP